VRKNDIPGQPARRYIRIRDAVSICKENVISSSLPEKSYPRAEIEPSSATHGADERGRGEAGSVQITGARRSGKGPEARPSRICFDLSR